MLKLRMIADYNINFPQIPQEIIYQDSYYQNKPGLFTFGQHLITVKTTKHTLPLVLLALLLGNGIPAAAQTSGSLQIDRLLSESDSLTHVARYPQAIQKAEAALQSSREKKYPFQEAMALLKIAEVHYRRADFHRLPFYDSAALQIGLRLKDNFITALSTYRLGVYFMSIDDHAQAFRLFDKALALKFGHENSTYTALVYNDIGVLHGKLNHLDKQVEWLLKALKIREQLQEETGIAQTCNNLAVAYNDARDYRTALQYGIRAVELRRKVNDVAGVAISANNLSQIYLRLDSIDQALHYQETGLRYAELSGLESRMAQSYISMALMLNRQKKNAEALEYEKKAIEILRRTGNNEMLARRQIAAGILSKITGDTAQALQFYQQAFDISGKLNNKSNIRDIYLNKTVLYKDYKDFYNAYEHYKKYILYRDSIINQETLVKISDAQAKYETEKKDNEIKQLANARRIQELETEKQKALATGNALLAQQRQNEIDLLSHGRELQKIKILQQQEDLEKQSLTVQNQQQALLLAQKETDLQEAALRKSNLLTNALIAGAVMMLIIIWFLFNRYKLKRKINEQQALLAVRNDIAKNLHDDIGSSLSNIHILNELAKKNTSRPALASEYLDKAGEDIQRISEDLNDIVWNINPRYDDLQQLFIRMKRYAADMLDGKNINYTLNFPDNAHNIGMTMERRRDFYLIFKEAVNNLVKYSQATAASIEVLSEGNKLTMKVEDNGIGFNHSQAQYGNGLSNMQQRAAFWKDRLNIKSSPGNGASIFLELRL